MMPALLLLAIGLLIALLGVLLRWRASVERQFAALKDSQQRAEERQLAQGEFAHEMKGWLSSSQQVQQHVSQHLQQLRAAFDERRRLDEANRQSLSRLEEIIAGTASKGSAGENILHEVFQQLPQDMVVRRVRIGGGEVEYALQLTNQKLLPIDSKWGSTSLLEEFERATDEHERDRLREDIDAGVTKHVLQVEKYIDPTLTVPWAVAVIPDAAYRLVRKAHVEAQRRHVFIVSYSLAVPYLLSFFHLSMQYNRSVDLEQLATHLADIQRTVEQMTSLLENNFERAGKMIQNGAAEYRQLLGRVRGSVTAITTSREQSTSTSQPAEEVIA